MLKTLKIIVLLFAYQNVFTVAESAAAIPILSGRYYFEEADGSQTLLNITQTIKGDVTDLRIRLANSRAGLIENKVISHHSENSLDDFSITDKQSDVQADGSTKVEYQIYRLTDDGNIEFTISTLIKRDQRIIQSESNTKRYFKK